MNNVQEALYLARQYTRVGYLNKAINCYEMAIYFMKQTKDKITDEHLYNLLNRHIEKCLETIQSLRTQIETRKVHKIVLLNQ